MATIDDTSSERIAQTTGNSKMGLWMLVLLSVTRDGMHRKRTAIPLGLLPRDFFSKGCKEGMKILQELASVDYVHPINGKPIKAMIIPSFDQAGWAELLGCQGACSKHFPVLFKKICFSCMRLLNDGPIFTFEERARLFAESEIEVNEGELSEAEARDLRNTKYFGQLFELLLPDKLWSISVDCLHGSNNEMQTAAIISLHECAGLDCNNCALSYLRGLINDAYTVNMQSETQLYFQKLAGHLFKKWFADNDIKENRSTDWQQKPMHIGRASKALQEVWKAHFDLFQEEMTRLLAETDMHASSASSSSTNTSASTLNSPLGQISCTVKCAEVFFDFDRMFRLSLCILSILRIRLYDSKTLEMLDKIYHVYKVVIKQYKENHSDVDENCYRFARHILSELLPLYRSARLYLGAGKPTACLIIHVARDAMDSLWSATRLGPGAFSLQLSESLNRIVKSLFSGNVWKGASLDDKALSVMTRLLAYMQPTWVGGKHQDQSTDATSCNFDSFLSNKLSDVQVAWLNKLPREPIPKCQHKTPILEATKKPRMKRTFRIDPMSVFKILNSANKISTQNFDFRVNERNDADKSDSPKDKRALEGNFSTREKKKRPAASSSSLSRM